MESYVLVVDDDPSIRSLLTEVLELAEYDVQAASNGVEALRAIDRRCPSVMVLDMQMPVLDGWGVARALREHGQRVPTVVITASASDAHQWCKDIAADASLGKPFELEDLLRAVARVHS